MPSAGRGLRPCASGRESCVLEPLGAIYRGPGQFTGAQGNLLGSDTLTHDEASVSNSGFEPTTSEQVVSRCPGRSAKIPGAGRVLVPNLGSDPGTLAFRQVTERGVGMEAARRAWAGPEDAPWCHLGLCAALS